MVTMMIVELEGLTVEVVVGITAVELVGLTVELGLMLELVVLRVVLVVFTGTTDEVAPPERFRLK